MTANFGLFEELLAAHSDDLATVCKGIAKLVVVDIALNENQQDNPQLIFESMNSTGRELGRADLISEFRTDGPGAEAAGLRLHSFGDQ